MNIKLRRDWQGQDSWGAFIEEVAIDFLAGKLTYRRSDGGNCNYGAYQPWEDETKALEFLLGPVEVTPVLRKTLIDALDKLPTLPALQPMVKWEEHCLDSTNCIINYGNY